MEIVEETQMVAQNEMPDIRLFAKWQLDTIDVSDMSLAVG